MIETLFPQTPTAQTSCSEEVWIALSNSRDALATSRPRSVTRLSASSSPNLGPCWPPSSRESPPRAPCGNRTTVKPWGRDEHDVDLVTCSSSAPNSTTTR